MLELADLPVVRLVVSPPARGSESRQVADQVAAQKLDINTSTESKQLRRVLRQVEVVVVAFGRGGLNQPLFNGVVASGIERMATKQPSQR